MKHVRWRVVGRATICGLVASLCAGASPQHGKTLHDATLAQAVFALGKTDHVPLTTARLSHYDRRAGHLELSGSDFWKDAAEIENVFGVKLQWAPDARKAVLEPVLDDGPGPLATRVAGPVRIDVEQRTVTSDDGQRKSVRLVVLRWLPGRQLLRAAWTPPKDGGSTELAGPVGRGECVIGAVEAGRSHELAGRVKLTWATRWQPVTVDLTSSAPVLVPDSNGVRSVVIDRATGITVDKSGRSRQVMLASTDERLQARTYEIRFRLTGIPGDEPPANCRILDGKGAVHRDFLVQDIRDPEGKKPRVFILDVLRWFSNAEPAKLVLDVPVKVQTQVLDLAKAESLSD